MLSTFDAPQFQVVANFDSKGDMFAKDYLATYYSGASVDPDEAIVLDFLVEKYRSIVGRPVVAELGCGPTIHHAIPLVGYTDELHSTDYLSSCTREVRSWLDRTPDSHNWNVFTKYVLAAEGRSHDIGAIEKRESDLREIIKTVGYCDLRRPNPLGCKASYDVVVCCYTTEQAAMAQAEWANDRRIDEWAKVFANLCSVVAPGGRLFMSCVRGSDHYKTHNIRTGETSIFPIPKLHESDFSRELSRHGFDLAKSEVVGRDFSGLEDEGVPGVILVSAVRKG